MGLFYKAIFGIFWYNFKKSDCKDAWSALFLCKKGPFFVFFDFPDERERISETLAINLKNSFRVREQVF